uniref:Alpha-mannosidase n=1 Tax=Syphacia muris TaxID=451379 RepID=A0A0N5ANJ3_9BILA
MLSVLFVFIIGYISSTAFADQCSFERCNDHYGSNDTINVHIICHTHDDLGWIKTVDQYYWGSYDFLVPVGVQYILDTVISELKRRPERKFSWAETGFLWRWLHTHDKDDREELDSLIKNGQLEIIGGGWVQNDEAASHYIDIIDQMSFGLRKLNETFGRCAIPKIAWQIDPFGHSREMANLFALMDFDALFFSRYHYLEKDKRLDEKKLEMMWTASDDLNTSIFTGTFYGDSYGPPPGFCFDALCNDEPIMDQKDMEEYNVDRKVQAFLSYVMSQASRQATNHIMLLMGSDFQYTNANKWYSNLDRLIKHVNKRSNETKVRAFYSTPTCYYKAVMAESQVLSTKTDDFFPYASRPHSYWTGYFTSRPTFKGFIRQSTSLLQLAKQFAALSMLEDDKNRNNLNVFRSALALLQHHDAVTGTAKQLVTFDYTKRLSMGWDDGEIVLNNALSKLSDNKFNATICKLCRLMNESICESTSRMSSFAVIVFNPDSHPKSSVIRIPYYRLAAEVTDFTGKLLDSQLSKTPFTSLIKIDASPYQLSVPVQIPALGYTTIYVNGSGEVYSKNRGKQRNSWKTLKPENNEMKSTKISSDCIELLFDRHGYLKAIKNLKTGIQTPLRQEFLYYEGTGSWPFTGQASGAYIFRPTEANPKPLKPGSIFLQVEKGPLVINILQVYSPWISQVIRLYKGKEYVEFEWMVGPIPKEQNNPITKEIITRYSTNIASNGTFYTDSNGRQMMKRRRDYSASYIYMDTEPVSANYYPVNSRIFVKDSELQLTVLTDRSEGGTSLNDGQIELMIHRRAFYDDGYGVEEPLDEYGDNKQGLIASGKHWLFVSNTKQAASIHRSLAFEMLYQPILTFFPIIKQDEILKQFSGLSQQLPRQLHILSLEQWSKNNYLLRIEHIYQKNEDPVLSSGAKVDLKA